MWRIYIKRAGAVFGITHTRDLYSRAIEALPDAEAREFCMQFADVERRLGEIDRARAIYAHGAQLCDPRIVKDFWKTWHDFEVRKPVPGGSPERSNTATLLG